tara:strand:+ start:2274 stop:2489 length:216 start_codon:yes stop_codon:yes gene_type:complete
MSKVCLHDELRTELYKDLLDLTEKAQDLGAPELIWLGISFFTQMALDCAPSVKEGRHLVKEAAKTVRKEAS